MPSRHWLSPFGKQCAESSVVVHESSLCRICNKEEAGYALWRTLLCERAYEHVKLLNNSKVVELLNSNPNLPKVVFVVDVFMTNKAIPCGSLKRGLKESSVSQMKRWRN